MTDAMARRYFSWHLFQVFEPYDMPLFVAKKLRALAPLKIAPGIYPVLETAEELIVIF